MLFRASVPNPVPLKKAVPPALLDNEGTVSTEVCPVIAWEVAILSPPEFSATAPMVSA